MAYKIAGICGAAALLWFAAGWTPAAFAEVPRSHCGVISHDVANLNAINPRHAYWCKSDIAGYLGEDRAAPIEPYHGYGRHHRRIIITRY
jgi:hypothetical protein